MNKYLIIFTIIVASSFANASMTTGTYIGINTDSGKDCKIEIYDDGDYLKSGKSIYRLTEHRKGPFIECDDYEGNIYDKCASGDHINGNKQKSIYMLISENNDIQKVYFQNEVSESVNDYICVDFQKI